jgi:metal-dependent amidase/aminoacylase/carboxypeptidase family protein
MLAAQVRSISSQHKLATRISSTIEAKFNSKSKNTVTLNKLAEQVRRTLNKLAERNSSTSLQHKLAEKLAKHSTC